MQQDTHVDIVWSDAYLLLHQPISTDSGLKLFMLDTKSGLCESTNQRSNWLFPQHYIWENKYRPIENHSSELIAVQLVKNTLK